MFHGYFYIENLNLTADQKTILVEQLKALGLRNTSNYPNERNHWRIRPDNDALIFEAFFDETHLTALALRNRLATIFGVANTAITYATTNTAYGPVVTYTYNSQQKLRVGVFGGPSATYQQSQDAALAFLTANAATWEV